MTEITFQGFVSKLSVTLIPFVLAHAWIIIRSFICDKFIYSGIELEKDGICEGRTEIKDLQEGNWAVNASQVQNFSAITIAIVLLVVVFIIEKILNVWTEDYLKIVIVIVGVSCLMYAFSLQFWNCALERDRSKAWSLAQRKIATTLQVVGWNGLYLSVILCVSLANTWCGLVLSMLGSFGLIITAEVKAKK